MMSLALMKFKKHSVMSLFFSNFITANITWLTKTISQTKEQCYSIHVFHIGLNCCAYTGVTIIFPDYLVENEPELSFVVSGFRRFLFYFVI